MPLRESGLPPEQRLRSTFRTTEQRLAALEARTYPVPATPGRFYRGDTVVAYGSAASSIGLTIVTIATPGRVIAAQVRAELIAPAQDAYGTIEVYHGVEMIGYPPVHLSIGMPQPGLGAAVPVSVAQVSLVELSPEGALSWRVVYGGDGGLDYQIVVTGWLFAEQPAE